MMKEQPGACQCVAQCFVVVQFDSEAGAAGVQASRAKALRPVDLDGAFPAVGEVEFGIIQAVVFHGSAQNAAIE